MEIIINDDSIRRIYHEDQNFADLVTFKVLPTKEDSELIIAKRSIQFKNCQFVKGLKLDLSLTSLKYSEIEFSFQDCYFKEALNVYDVNNEVVSISLVNCVVNESKISKSKIKNVVASRTLFLERLVIQDTEVPNIVLQNTLGNIFINDEGKINCNVRFSDDNLHLERNKIFDLYKKVIDSRGLQNILFYPTTFHFYNVKVILVKFQINGKREGYKILETPQSDNTYSKEIHYYLKKEDVNKLNIGIQINQSKSLTEIVNIKSAILRSLYITGESESKVKIDHVISDNFYLSDFQSKEFSMYDFKNRNLVDSKFEIKNSKFPESSFTKIRFNSFLNVNFYRSYMEKATFASCTFPKSILTIENIHYPNEKEEDYFGMQTEVYRQLTFSLSTNNNQLQGLEMHQRMYNVIRKKEDLSFQDKLILCLNRISNNHNTSITRAFFLTTSIILVLWVLYNMVLPNAPYKFGWNGFCDFKKAIMDFFVFLYKQTKVLTVIANPVHSTSNLIELNKEGGKFIPLSTGNYVISFISRILVAWGYYQFVAAFRKFGKSL